MRDVLPFYPPFCMIYELNKSVFKERISKGLLYIHAGVLVNIKGTMFNL